MVGLALVTVVATLGAGLRESDREALESSVDSDYVVTSKNGFEPFPAAAGAALPRGARGQPRLQRAQRQGQGRSATKSTVNGVARQLRQRLQPRTGAGVRRGPRPASARAAPSLEEGYAEDHGLARRRPVHDRDPPSGASSSACGSSGSRRPTEVQKIDPLLGKVLISERAFDASFPRPSNIYTFVDTDGGETRRPTPPPSRRRSSRFPDAVAYTKAGWVEKRASGIDTLLNLLYVLLALSVIVSLFGMVNTLVLSVFERTREIGMLRAVGMTRRQVRRMIRQESVITALIGAGLGLPLGIFLAAVFTQILSDQGIGFSLPVGSLIAFTIVAILAGILAAVLPARRASRLDVLEALQYE